MTVSAGIENKNRERAQAAILQQMEDLRQGIISDTEWHAARTSLENAYRQSYDNPFELQSFYGNRILFGIDGTIEETRQKIAAVTREDVIALAKTIQCDTVFYIEGTRQDPVGEEDFDDELI